MKTLLYFTASQNQTSFLFIHFNLFVCFFVSCFWRMQISPTLPNILQWPYSLSVQGMTWHAAYAGEEVSKSRKHQSHVL